MPRNKPLTNIQILKYAANVPYFRGVFMKDALPTTPLRNEAAVINLDNSENPGTHWVAYKKKGEVIHYYDSFGDLKPPSRVLEYLKGCKIFYNVNQDQDFSTSNCGQLCLKFLYSEPTEIIYKVIVS